MESWVHSDVGDHDVPEGETSAVQDTKELKGLSETCLPAIDSDVFLGSDTVVGSGTLGSENLAVVGSGLDLADSEQLLGPVKT